MTAKKRLIESKGEARLHDLAKTMFNVSGADRVHLKVRLADVFDLSAAIWAPEEKTFMLQAHFDLLITDEEFNPRFAIEYDTDYHATLVQRRRDTLKDSICKKGDLPIRRFTWDEISYAADILKDADKVEDKVKQIDWLLSVNAAMAVVNQVIGRRFELDAIPLIEIGMKLANHIYESQLMRPSNTDAEEFSNPELDATAQGRILTAFDMSTRLPFNSLARFHYQMLLHGLERDPLLSKIEFADIDAAVEAAPRLAINLITRSKAFQEEVMLPMMDAGPPPNKPNERTEVEKRVLQDWLHGELI